MCPIHPRSPLVCFLQYVELASFGVASSPGGRPYQDDRSTAFSTRLLDGTRISLGAVLDGHHGYHVSELIADSLPRAFLAAIAKWPHDVASALVRVLHTYYNLTVISHLTISTHHIKPILTFFSQADTIRALDDIAFQAHISGSLPTGGSTLILHAISGNQIYTANVGDCKTLLSSRGAPVETEKERFSAAGISCFSDHIGGSDINVCRTIGDYDLGPPLKWRDESGTISLGPLISDPEITVRRLEPIDEFLVVASDGLWDYYTPETSVVTEARRRLRAVNDPQAAAEWLVEEALQRQRVTLHSGTPGDNVTVMVIQLRKLPEIPRARTSRLNLQRGSGEYSNGTTPRS